MTLALPPDTDTPGYANELKNKPLETLLISETAKLFTPEEVGIKILHDALVILKQFYFSTSINTFYLNFLNVFFRMGISLALLGLKVS